MTDSIDTSTDTSTKSKTPSDIFISGPIVGFIGALILCPMMLVTFFIAAVVLLPYVTSTGIPATIKSKRIGPCAKVLLLLIGYPLAVIIILPLSAIAGGIIGLAEGAFSGFVGLEIVTITLMGLCMGATGLGYGLNSFLLSELPPNSQAVEVNPIKGLILLICLFIGAAVGVVWFTICGVIFAFPNLARIYMFLYEVVRENGLIYLLSMILLIPLVPLAYVFVILLDPLAGFVLCLIAPLCAIMDFSVGAFRALIPDEDPEAQKATKKATENAPSVFQGVGSRLEGMFSRSMSEREPLLEREQENEGWCRNCGSGCKMVSDVLGFTKVPYAMEAILEICQKRFSFGSSMVYLAFSTEEMSTKLNNIAKSSK